MKDEADVWNHPSGFILHPYSLCRFRQRLLLSGTEEAEQLHFDNSRVVAGLDAEDALKNDLFAECLFVRSQAELFGDRSGDEVLEHAAVERARQRDSQRGADDAC